MFLRRSSEAIKTRMLTAQNNQEDMSVRTVTPSSHGQESTANDVDQSGTTAERINTNNYNMTEDDVDRSLIRYCKLVVARPKLCFGITLSLHLLMILLTVILLVSGYDILPVDFGGLPLDLPEDSTKLRTDAWLYALEGGEVNPLSGGQQERGKKYQSLQLVYELKGGNVFTRENLMLIKANEEKLFNYSNYQTKLCQLVYFGKNATCKLPLSILRFFDGSYSNIDPVFNDSNFQNIVKVIYTAKTLNVSRALLNYHLGKDAMISSTEVSSPYTRSLMHLGYPYAGYKSTEDRKDDQQDEINKVITDTYANILDEMFKDGIGDMNFYYNNNALMVDAITKQVVLDMMLAVASFIFIFLFMWLQTGSLWLTAWAIFSIMSSFVITNLIYRIVFDFRYIGIFHVLSIFIVLGIGADDIFVFMDTWKQSQHTNYKSLAHRLSDVYRRAAKAMLITSFTTMMAFLSNVTSPLLAISSFGLFSGILVFVNYCSVILFFPTVAILHHISRKGRCCCGPMCGQGSSPRDMPTESKENLEMDNSSTRKKTISEHITTFFGGWFFRNIISHKVVRWVVLAIFLVIIGVSIGFATQLEPDKEQTKLWTPATNWAQVDDLNQNAFVKSQEDVVVVVTIVWGLREQDRSDCHHTDFRCKGKTVLDNGFDLNPPPCQTAMLEFCSELKKLPSEKETSLHLRRSEVTGEVETKCVFERMDEYLQDEGNDSKYPNGSKFAFPINAEKMRGLMTYNPKLYNVSKLPDSYYRYFEIGLGYFITDGGSSTYQTTYDFVKYGDLLGGVADPTLSINNSSRDTYLQGNKYGHRLGYVGVAINTTLNVATLGYEKGLPIYRDWEKFVNEKMEQLPSSCNGGFQATVEGLNVWHWLKVQEILVNNAIRGILIGIFLALVILIVATTNVMVGVLSTFIIAMITCAVLGIITMIGWKLGPLESLNLTLVVGLAVDYVVHLAEGYMELENENRVNRVRHTLSHVGISVLSGACTTLGASIFMLAARILFFFQFAIFIFCTIGFSILFSLFLFTTTLALVGPEGETGSVLPLVRRGKDFVRGKTKHDINCELCKGKGFYKKEMNGGIALNGNSAVQE